MFASACGALAMLVTAIVCIVRNNTRRIPVLASPRASGHFPQDKINPDLDGTLYRRAAVLVSELIQAIGYMEETGAALHGWQGRYTAPSADQQKLLGEAAVLLLQTETSDRTVNYLDTAPDTRQRLSSWLDECLNRKEEPR